MIEENYSIEGTPLLEEAIHLGQDYADKEDQLYKSDHVMYGLLYVCNMDLIHLTEFSSLHALKARRKLRVDVSLQEAIEEQKDLRLRFGEAGYGYDGRESAIEQIAERLNFRNFRKNERKELIIWFKNAELLYGDKEVTASQFLDIILENPTPAIRRCLPKFFEKKASSVNKKAEKLLDQKRKELAWSAMDLYTLEESLMTDIKGQEEAVDTFVRGFSSINLFPSESGEKRGPAAIFLLAGPPGVGKTFLATKMAELCNYESLVLDMSGYSHGKDSIESLTGFDSTYKDSHEGALTGFVDQNPESVVVFDDKDFRSASKDYRRTDGQPLGEWLEILGEEWTERNEKHLGFIRAEEYRKGVPKQQTEEEKDRREREWELLAEVLSGDHKAGEEGYYFPEDLKDRAPNMSLYGVEIYGLVNKSQWTKRLRKLKPEEQK